MIEGDDTSFTTVGVTGTLGDDLMQILLADAIVPGTAPSYEIAKLIYLSHPLGGKMVDKPIKVAQSQPRKIAVQGAPDEVVKAFEDEWRKLAVDGLIANTVGVSRIYGIGSCVLGCEDVPSDKPLDMEKLWDLPIFFNVLDPLNTAGSLVLNQISTAPDFNKPGHLATGGQSFHRSRYQVVMHEKPIFISFTTSAFGFVGRSVYQRALFPLKSFILSMIADHEIQKKLALLIAKKKAPGTTINQPMLRIAGYLRGLLKRAINGDVFTIGVDEELETLNMQNVDGAGTYSRTNIIHNIATACDMPATMLDDETLTEGFGEGTEDAKKEAQFIDRVRVDMQPLYGWFDNIVQYRAWNPQFYLTIQAKYPEMFGAVDYQAAFSQWRAEFMATWPSVLIEPESEQIKVDEVRLEATVALLQTLVPLLDPANKVRAISWAADNVEENKMLFAHALELDLDTLQEFAKQQQTQQDEAAKNAAEGGGEEQEGGGPMAKKFAKFDSVRPAQILSEVRRAVTQLPAPAQRRRLTKAK
jgi:hypothetical protein